MDCYDVRRLALVLATQAEVEGMKAENTQQQAIGSSVVYSQDDFCVKADELRNLAYCDETQL